MIIDENDYVQIPLSEIKMPEATAIFLRYIFQYFHVEEDNEYFYLPNAWMSAGESLEDLLVEQGVCLPTGGDRIEIPKSLFYTNIK